MVDCSVVVVVGCSVVVVDSSVVVVVGCSEVVVDFSVDVVVGCSVVVVDCSVVVVSDSEWQNFKKNMTFAIERIKAKLKFSKS